MIRNVPLLVRSDLQTPFARAAFDGNLRELKNLVAREGELREDPQQIPALVALAAGNSSERLQIAKWLLEQGADADATAPNGDSAAHFASQLGDTQILGLLSTHRANLNLENQQGKTPLATAAGAGMWPALELLLGHDVAVNPARGAAPLAEAALLPRDDPAGVELLLRHKADVNHRGKLGRTALMGAALRGNAQIADALLAAGADVNARDDFGNTALMEAARSGANGVLERLVFWNPETEHRDKPGRTALLVAVSSTRADAETIRLLMAMGAEPDVSNREGRKAGDLAAAAGRWRIADALGTRNSPVPLAEPAAATDGLATAENVIDLKQFETPEDRDWAERQLNPRSRTQLESATLVMPAIKLDEAEADTKPDSEVDQAEESASQSEPEQATAEAADPAADTDSEQPPVAEPVSEPETAVETGQADAPSEGAETDAPAQEVTDQTEPHAPEAEADAEGEEHTELAAAEASSDEVEASNAEQATESSDAAPVAEVSETSTDGTKLSDGVMPCEEAPEAEATLEVEAQEHPAADTAASDGVTEDAASEPDDSPETEEEAEAELHPAPDTDAGSAAESPITEESSKEPVPAAAGFEQDVSEATGQLSGTPEAVSASFTPPPAFELVPEDLPVPGAGNGEALENAAATASDDDGATHEESEDSQSTAAVDADTAEVFPDLAALGEDPTAALISAVDIDLGSEAENTLAADPQTGEIALSIVSLEPEEPDMPATADGEAADAMVLTDVVDLSDGVGEVDAEDLGTGGAFGLSEAQQREQEEAGYAGLMDAALVDDTEQMKAVLLSQPEAPAWWLSSAFLNSVAAGRAMAPRWLLENGLGANALSRTGDSLLSCVLQQAPTPVDIVELLLSRGSQVESGGQQLIWVAGFADAQHEQPSGVDDTHEQQLAELAGKLIGDGAVVDEQDALGRTALHWAATHRDKRFVNELLAAGADANAQDEGGNTALMLALEVERPAQLGVLRALLQAGADPKLANSEGVSPLGLAMKNDDATLQNMLMRGSRAEAAEKPAEPTPGQLVRAASEGNLGRVKRLLAQGHNVNERDSELCSPLLRASGAGHPNVVGALLAAGADGNLPAANGTTPLGTAVLGGHREVVRLLVDRGVDVNQRQQFGVTPLMLAAARWQPRMIKLLLSLGADVRQRDETQSTVLMAAVQNALHSTDVENGSKTIEALLAAGAEVNATNDEGQTALMLLLGVRAREDDSLQIKAITPLTRLLIGREAALDSQDLTGWSALHAAAARGLLGPVQELLAAGANKRLRDINGLSACDLAMDASHDQLVDLFLAS
ncbi:MAG: ankyrin repeat domain-containing protein [Pseudomonadota bacterium]